MILQSILDSDLYKLSMQQAVCQLFPDVHVRYRFVNRGQTRFRKGFADELKDEISKKTGFRIQHHRLDFFGVCQECQGAT